MDTSPHFQKLSNPNPNFDHVAHTTHHDDQLNDHLLYFCDISKYLMSDESLEGSASSQKKDENIMNGSEKSPNSIPVAHNMKCGRILKNYKEKQEVRLAFRTKSNLEFMDDGFKWRKYGKKMVKSSPYPRNYFKCSNGGCNVKKTVERDRDDSSYVITTYQGVHNHESPTVNSVFYCSPQPNFL